MAKSFTFAILDWARSKPADEAYDYVDPGNCAICQFLAETGRARAPRVRHDTWRDGLLSDDMRPLPDGLDAAAVEYPQTFGAFADRLAKLVSA